MKKHPLYGMDDSFQIQGSSEKASSELDECLPQELLELKSRDAIIWQGVQEKVCQNCLSFKGILILSFQQINNPLLHKVKSVEHWSGRRLTHQGQISVGNTVYVSTSGRPAMHMSRFELHRKELCLAFNHVFPTLICLRFPMCSYVVCLFNTATLNIWPSHGEMLNHNMVI